MYRCTAANSVGLMGSYHPHRHQGLLMMEVGLARRWYSCSTSTSPNTTTDSTRSIAVGLPTGRGKHTALMENLRCRRGNIRNIGSVVVSPNSLSCHQVRFYATGGGHEGGEGKKKGFDPEKAEPFSNNLYERLGLHKHAKEHEIKAAYHHFAKKFHPDANPEDTKAAADRFHHIKEARDILANQAKRKIYDQTGRREDAKDPRRYKMRQRAKLWFPFLLASIAFLGTSFYSRVVHPAKKSSNIRTRYFINFVGAWAIILAFPSLLASAILVYGHSGMYRDDMMRDITDHILWNVRRVQQNSSAVGRLGWSSGASSGSGSKTTSNSSGGATGGNAVSIEIIPEDDDIKAAMEGLQLELTYAESKVVEDAQSGTSAPASTSTTSTTLEPNVFEVVIPLSHFQLGSVEVTLKGTDRSVVVAKRKVPRTAVGLPPLDPA